MTDSTRAGLADDEAARFRDAIEGPLSKACDRGTGLVIEIKPTGAFISLSVEWNWLVGQTSSNKFLSPKNQLTESQLDRLVSLGWEEPNERFENFNKGWEGGVGDSVALAVATLDEVHGVRNLDEITIEIDELEGDSL